MERSVKSDLGRRARKALGTRHRMLDAAEALFVRDGYAATTVAAIAEEADVAVQTVYAVFGTKRAILTELLAVRVVGDENTVPLRDREDWRVIEQEGDPRQQLALFAALATQIGNRIADLYQVTAAAAGSDAEIAEMYRTQQQARYKDQRRLARSLARKGTLRAGLSVTQATDIMWTVANPHTHHALIGERGWTENQYREWLERMLSCALLPDPSTRSGRQSAL